LNAKLERLAAFEASQKATEVKEEEAAQPFDPFEEAVSATKPLIEPIRHFETPSRTFPVSSPNLAPSKVLPEPYRTEVSEIITVLDAYNFTSSKGDLSKSKSYKRLRELAGL
jgi:hypothetical protein